MTTGMADIAGIIDAIRSYIKSEKESGIKELLLPKRRDAGNGASGANALDDVYSEVIACKECGLAATRTNVVFGEGPPDAKLVFVGEAPGRDEDLMGLPFVGRAGQLLTKIIESIGFKRSDVYIVNVLKCRPPENRNPMPDEIIACKKYLLRQIKIINPKVICPLGKFSSQLLLGTDKPISQIRGKVHDYGNAKIVPTFHPAYLLRNPVEKRLVWEDMKSIKKIVEG